MNIVDEIVEIEWKMFQTVNNVGGPASCQSNYDTFKVMRVSQFLAFNDQINKSYYNDLIDAQNEGRNLLEEKYARMMYFTHNSEYEDIKNMLPAIIKEQYELVEDIASYYQVWEEEFILKFPNISKFSRISSNRTSTSVYLRGEMLTYSMNTLKCIKAYVDELKSKNINLVERINYITMRFCGHKTLDEAEKFSALNHNN